MGKVNLKKHKVRISLIFILLISIFLCTYTIINYNGNNINIQNNKLRIEVNKFNNNLNNMENGQNKPENMPSLNKEQTGSNENSKDSKRTNQPNENGNTDEANENRQPGLNKSKPPGLNENMQRENTNTKYSSALNVYSLLFLILCIVMYYIFRRKNIKINVSDEKIVIFTLLAVGLLLRISASTVMDGHNDINLFKNWAETAANNFSQFYSNAKSADYPPLYIYVLALIGKVASISYFKTYFVLMLKIPSIIADIITAYLIYILGKKYFKSERGILLSAFYIFNPAIFIDSTFWGQVDSIFTLMIVVAVFLLSEKKIIVSSAVFAAAILMKPQGIIFLPILFFELIREKSIKNFIKAAFSAFFTAVAIILPFSLNGQSPLWIFKLYSNTISEYPYASVNAFNFFSLIGANYTKNTDSLFIFNYHTWGMIFIVVTTLISWAVYIKNNNRNFVSAIALLQIAGVFTFSVGMHERYLFPAVALSILSFIYLKDKRFFILSIGFSITSYINIYSVLFNLNSSNFKILLIITSFFNIVLVICLVKVLFESFIKCKS